MQRTFAVWRGNNRSKGASWKRNLIVKIIAAVPALGGRFRAAISFAPPPLAPPGPPWPARKSAALEPRKLLARDWATCSWSALGGLGKLVSGREVVLKPNILNAQPYPVTTPVETVIAIGKHAQKAGATSITACDGNSGSSARAVKFEGLGYPAALKAEGFKMDAVGFDDKLSHIFVKKEGWRSHPTIGVAKTLHEADVIINIPVVKRHDGARFTCALKNHFGSVYGSLRFIAHGKMQKEGDSGKEFFDVALAEFADSVRPELNIVDARTLLMRAGPSMKPNSEAKEGINRIVLCGDMIATDLYCSQLMAENDDTYSTDMISVQIEAAQRLGLGVGDLNNVAIKEIIA